MNNPEIQLFAKQADPTRRNEQGVLGIINRSVVVDLEVLSTLPDDKITSAHCWDRIDDLEVCSDKITGVLGLYPGIRYECAHAGQLTEYSRKIEQAIAVFINRDDVVAAYNVA